MRQYCLLFALLLCGKIVSAQAVEHNLPERNINSDRYFRLDYGNDYFTATDYYQTQTVFLEFVHPALFRNPISKLTVRPRRHNELRYGLAQNGYTPTDYVPSTILYGDRPFAGTLSLRTFTIATDTLQRLVFRNNWALVAQIGKVYLEYYQSYMTKEFNTGMDMHNGGIQIGVGF